MLPRCSVQSVEVNAIGVAPLFLVNVTVVEAAVGVIEPLEMFARVDVEQIEVIFNPAE